jgi:hypothetical protein
VIIIENKKSHSQVHIKVKEDVYSLKAGLLDTLPLIISETFVS